MVRFWILILPVSGSEDGLVGVRKECSGRMVELRGSREELNPGRSKGIEEHNRTEMKTTGTTNVLTVFDLIDLCLRWTMQGGL